MLLTIDIGNSSIDFGVFNGEKLIFKSKMSAVKSKCVDEYAVTLKNILSLGEIDSADITDSIISSVVPPLTKTIAAAVEKLTKTTPLEVGPGIKTGLNIKIDIQTQLGADIVANAVAASAKCSCPLIIIDFGSATTFTVINRNGVLDGVIIAPGVRMSLDALAYRTSALPDVSIEKPKRLIAKNTNESMNVGVLYGQAFMIDGFIENIKKTMNEETVNVIATGGLAEIILPLCKAEIKHIPNLTLLGLRLIHLKNRK